MTRASLVALVLLILAAGSVLGKSSRHRALASKSSNSTGKLPKYPPQYDIATAYDQFLPCDTESYALCYYAPCAAKRGSGKYGPMPWEKDPFTSTCLAGCLPGKGHNYVLQTSILNPLVKAATDAACPHGSTSCNASNSAPVCKYVDDPKKFYAKLPIVPDVLSTFGLDYFRKEQFGNGKICPIGPFAGCMTAPCWNEPIVIMNQTFPITCACPLVTAPFQLGTTDPSIPCSYPKEDVALSASLKTFRGPVCLPDVNCPLWNATKPCAPGVLKPVIGYLAPLCKKACKEVYACRDAAGAGATFTCDSVKCSSTNNTVVAPACAELTKCDLSSILEVEQMGACSCCVEAICGCEPDARTLLALKKLQAADPTGFHNPVGCIPE